MILRKIFPALFFLPKSETQEEKKIDGLDIYNNIISDINYIKDKYHAAILASLQSDLPLYQQMLDGVDGDYSNIWKISETSFSTIKLVKQKNYDRMIVDIRYSDELSKSFKIKDIDLIFDRRINIVPNSDLTNVIHSYIIADKIASRKKELDVVKSHFDKMSKYIGKDTYRDSRIDEILK